MREHGELKEIKKVMPEQKVNINKEIDSMKKNQINAGAEEYNN